MMCLFLVWRDATSSDDWCSLSELELSCHKIASVGFLLHEDEETLVLALNRDPSEEAASQVIRIPKAWILFRQIVEFPELGLTALGVRP